MKRIVICCDGTWQRPLQNFRGVASPTNVVRLAVRVAKRDGDTPQIVYYDQGVGTGDVIDAIRGGLVGAGVDQNIVEAYRFLVANYEFGDQIFLFGFSRGAYTVRSLAGMIRKCGIVRRDKVVNEGSALELYRDAQHPEDDAPSKFRRETSVAGDRAIPIQCIGVWDTVGALGLPGTTSKNHAFHDTKLSGTVQFAFHALAIDERRKAFLPTLWQSPVEPWQTLEQVWFSGSHSDIGGGIGSRGLPDITLAYMYERAQRAGLVFDPAVLAAYPMNPDALAPFNLLERSRVWSLLGTTDRAIGVDTFGKPDPSQRVAASALARWDGDASYRPKNVAAYLRALRDPRPT